MGEYFRDTRPILRDDSAVTGLALFTGVILENKSV